MVLVSILGVENEFPSDVLRRRPIRVPPWRRHDNVFRAALHSFSSGRTGLAFIAPHEVLHVEAALGPRREHQARHDGIGSAHERVHTRQARVSINQWRDCTAQPRVAGIL